MNYRWGFCKVDDGYMVCEPPPAERLQAVRDMIAGKRNGVGVTTRRIAIVETSHYMGDEEAAKIAALLGAAPDYALLLAGIMSGFVDVSGPDVVVKGMYYVVDYDEFGCPILTDKLRAAIAPPRGQGRGSHSR
jgi:hypothetical protein